MQLEIVEEARRGSRPAFELLASSVLDRLHGAASLILHDGALAEDAVQETLIQVWRDLPRLRDPERFEPWLHSMLVHRCLDLARRSRPQRLAIDLPAALADPGNDLQAEAASRDLVRRGMERLKPQHRGVLVMRYYLGLSVPQMAEALRVPLGTAKSRLHSAEGAMRNAIRVDSRLTVEGGRA